MAVLRDRAFLRPARGFLVPVGLLYEEKTLFRSRAAAAVGEPFTITDLEGAWKADERACAQALTGRIDRALAEVVLQAPLKAFENGTTIQGYVKDSRQIAGDGAWTEIVSKGFADVTGKVKAKLVGL